jgi:curved DNA-binding protein CbpA
MSTPAAPAASSFRGSLSETPLPAVLRRIFLEGLKGTLTLVRGDETRHLFFEKGELRTATSSREGQRIGAFLKRRGWITDQDLAWALETVSRQGRARLGKILVEKGFVSRAVLDSEMKRLVEEIVYSTFEWEDGEFRFQASTGVLDPDVALSLSTAAIIVEGLRRLPEAEKFRDRLGDGRRIPGLASDPMSRYQYLPLTPQEAYLLSRIDGVTDLDSLLKIGGASRGATAKTLYALLSCGIVEWRAQGQLVRVTQSPEGYAGLNVEVGTEEGGRSPGHLELVRNTYRRIDWLSHYELLGVQPGAIAEQIEVAYHERSRLFHPDLRHREDLKGLEKELTAVFDRLKRAYEELTNPERRAKYDAALQAPQEVLVDPSADPAARKRLAMQNFRRAKELIEEKDFFPAIEMLLEAVRFVPDNAEFRFTLGSLELKNASWVDRGLENLKEAARLEPRKVNYIKEAARALLEHHRAAEAEPFARRAHELEPTQQSAELLDAVIQSMPSEPQIDFGASAAPASPETPEAAPQPEERQTLFSRLFRKST